MYVFGSVASGADAGMPKRLSRLGLVRYQVLPVAAEQQTAGSGQESGASLVFMPPHDLTGPVVDRVDLGPIRDTAAAHCASETHGATRIWIDQVADAERVALGYVEEARLRTEGWGRVVGHVAIDKRAGNR